MTRRVVVIPALLLLGAVGWWLLFPAPGDENPASSVDRLIVEVIVGPELAHDGIAQHGDRLQDRESEGEAEAAADLLLVLEALATGEDVFDALEQRAWVAGWSEQELGEAMAFWAALCGPMQVPSEWRWRSVRPVPDEVANEAAGICSSYQAGPSELAAEYDPAFMQHYQRGEVAFEVIAKRLQERLQPIEFERLMRQLRDALAEGRFEQVRDVVWALHAFGLFEHPTSTDVAENRSPLQERPFVSTMVLEAMGSKLMCRRLAGCREQHPLVLRFCSIDPQRPCLRPTDIDDAISDVLMGSEILLYERLMRQIEKGLALVNS